MARPGFFTYIGTVRLRRRGYRARKRRPGEELGFNMSPDFDKLRSSQLAEIGRFMDAKSRDSPLKSSA